MPEVKLEFDVELVNPVQEKTDIEISTVISKTTNDGKLETKIYKCLLNEKASITIDDIEDCKYDVIISMSGKTDADTLLKDDEVIKSTEVKLDNFEFDEYDITEILEKQAIYTHDNNGYGKMHDEPFSKYLGCNGKVKFSFTTPLYLWLLENVG